MGKNRGRLAKADERVYYERAFGHSYVQPDSSTTLTMMPQSGRKAVYFSPRYSGRNSGTSGARMAIEKGGEGRHPRPKYTTIS